MNHNGGGGKQYSNNLTYRTAQPTSASMNGTNANTSNKCPLSSRQRFDDQQQQTQTLKGNQKILDQITPELAALIVKEYVLPMFESDAKKEMRKNKLPRFKLPEGKDTNSVYGELKLSQQLGD